MFLFGISGHRNSDREVLRSKWVAIDTLSVILQSSAPAIHDMIKKETAHV